MSQTPRYSISTYYRFLGREYTGIYDKRLREDDAVDYIIAYMTTRIPMSFDLLVIRRVE